MLLFLTTETGELPPGVAELARSISSLRPSISIKGANWFLVLEPFTLSVYCIVFGLADK